MTMADGPIEATGPVCLVVVPDSGVPLEALVTAVRFWQPTWDVRAVWAGDPQLVSTSTVDWPVPAVAADVTELELAAVEPESRPLLVASRARRDIDDRPAVVLVAGSVAVLGPIDAMVPLEGRMTIVPRCTTAPRGHGAPGLAELGRCGRSSGSVFSFGVRTAHIAAWLGERLLDPEPASAGVLLDLAADVFGVDRCPDERVGASVWRWPDVDPVLVEAPGHDPTRPWLLDPLLDGPPRVSVAAPERLEVMRVAAQQLGGPVRPLRLPGGIEIDDVVRHILRHDPPADSSPWSDAGAVRQHLERRYWAVAHSLLPQLRWRFPSPFGADSDGFAHWASRAGFIGEAPVLLDPSAAVSDLSTRRTGASTDGVNVVGYFHHQSGVGNIARRIAAILDRHGVPHTTVAFGRTENPRLADPPRTDQELRYATSIVVVNGDQVPVLRADVPDLFGPDRHVVGVWFWELESFDGAVPGGARLVDEIWATTTFMATAFRSLGTAPVSLVPIPFERPAAERRPISSFGPLAGFDGRFVFGVVYDHLSVIERKNPLAAVRAFREAFRPDEGPVLVIKSINGHRHWQEQEQVRAATGGRDDIVVWDELLTRSEHLDLIASLDALVSLHRSEGVGLHLAEAMSLGVPVIATRYSGNLDFMDDTTAFLVDAEIVPIGSRGGWAYPPTARWAEPDLGQAVAAMRDVVADHGRRAAVVTAASASIAAYADEAAFVSAVRAAFGGRPRPDR